ncbi:YciI family protein [Frigidibacter oleivorans]|uniref:YciI family protein n=1 Tax=Frigidibacter oleivorans TaxID=2487129 RepID=UPI000F8C9F55|nr:transcription initiation protein [Frigidibacter oleivorans]
MTKYLISFPAEAMVLTEDEFVQAGIDSHAVIAEAQAAGVYVFAGGIHEGIAPVLVPAEGPVTPGTHPGSRLTGGFTVLELPTRAAAEDWARKLAAACRCPQELRAFMDDPLS